MRRLVYYVGAIIILAPILPLYALHALFDFLANGIEWLVRGRAIPEYLVRLTNKLETWSNRAHR